VSDPTPHRLVDVTERLDRATERMFGSTFLDRPVVIEGDDRDEFGNRVEDNRLA
jgi:hypothetical protein